jgi:hypothetical protein
MASMARCQREVRCAFSRNALGYRPVSIRVGSEVDTRPKLLMCPDQIERKTGLHARVQVSLVLGRDGRAEPGTITVGAVDGLIPGAGEGEFRQRARDMASECVWAPALVDQEPVRVRMTRTFRIEPRP